MRVMIAAIAVIAIAAIAWAANLPSPSPSSDFAALSDLQFMDYNGVGVSLSDYSGKPLVINSWASWCPFCVKELPDFVRAQQEFAKAVVIIAINREESFTAAKDYTDGIGITNDLIFLMDPDDHFYRTIGGFSMPETIFVNRDGMIVDHKRGPMDFEEIQERIMKIL